MDIEEEVIKNKGKIKMTEVKLNALINILTKEGITSQEEIEDEVRELVQENEEDG